MADNAVLSQREIDALINAEIGNAEAGTFSGATSNVKADNVSQRQNGSRNEQKLRIGNAKGSTFQSATSNVVANNISQTQSGSRNKQGMNLGNAE